MGIKGEKEEGKGTKMDPKTLAIFKKCVVCKAVGAGNQTSPLSNDL